MFTWRWKAPFAKGTTSTKGSCSVGIAMKKERTASSKECKETRMSVNGVEEKHNLEVEGSSTHLPTRVSHQGQIY